MKRFRVICLFALLVGLLFSGRVVFADTGPKPTMEFTFQQDLPEGAVTITSGKLYECEQPTCSDATELQEGGPQRFTCETESCRARAYGFADYHKLQIKFSDGKTRESNVFATAGFESKYTVTIRADDLLVEAQTSAFPRVFAVVLVGLCLLALGLVVVGLIVFLLRRCPKN